MIDPRPLLDEGTDPFESAVLASADLDVGSHQAFTRSLAAFAAVSLLAVHGSAAVGPLAAATKWMMGSFTLKCVGIGAVVGLGALAAAHGLRYAGDSSRAALPRSMPRVVAEPELARRWLPSAEASRTDAPPASSPGPMRVASSSPLSSTHHTRLKAVSKHPARHNEMSTTLEQQLSREVALLDEARSLLVRGKKRAALVVLESRNREIGVGVLGPEANVLQVEALLGLGDRAAAEAIARRYLSTHPRGPHADRLNALLEAHNP